jgi:hypothetical protein
MDFQSQIFRWREASMDGAGLSEAVPKNELLPTNPRTLCKVFVRARPVLAHERLQIGQPVEGRRVTNYELNDFEAVTVRDNKVFLHEEALEVGGRHQLHNPDITITTLISPSRS